MVDINLLRIGGRAVAFNYNYHADGVVFGLRTGFRKDAPNSGVGAALTLLTLQDSFARGDNRFELGAGEQDYKRRIRTGAIDITRLSHAPMTSWRSQAVRIGRWVRSRRDTAPAAGAKSA